MPETVSALSLFTTFMRSSSTVSCRSMALSFNSQVIAIKSSCSFAEVVISVRRAGTSLYEELLQNGTVQD